ncbi:MAG: hypothetical protein CSB34_01805 [Desulfobulbus propionicus]|nr:MAG: hypothetical protein CSB34_01805 [Desulfobulbus propionicus]
MLFFLVIFFRDAGETGRKKVSASFFRISEFCFPEIRFSWGKGDDCPGSGDREQLYPKGKLYFCTDIIVTKKEKVFQIVKKKCTQQAKSLIIA